MLKSIAKILIFVSAIFVSNLSLAGQVTALYDVEVLVIDESKEVRNQAFKARAG